MRSRGRTAVVRACLAAGSLLAVGAIPCLAQSDPSITGQWEFDNGNLNATVGTAADYWVAVSGRDVEAETQFGTTTSFGIPDIGGQPANVMKFPQTDSSMGYSMFPDIEPNGGGSFVNQYTIIQVKCLVVPINFISVLIFDVCPMPAVMNTNDVVFDAVGNSIFYLSNEPFNRYLIVCKLTHLKSW